MRVTAREGTRCVQQQQQRSSNNSSSTDDDDNEDGKRESSRGSGLPNGDAMRHSGRGSL